MPTNTDTQASSPTWANAIADFFTQYERVQMAPFGLDLGSYESVRSQASSILSAVSPTPNPGGPPMPAFMPLQVEQWSAEKIARFQAWIDAGCPYGPPAPTPAPTGQAFAGFVAVSRALTGFPDIGTNLASERLAHKYMDRLRSEVMFGDSLVDALISTYDAIVVEAPADAAATAKADWIHTQIQARIMADPTLGAFARTVILAWYMGSIGGVLGTPDDNQYIDGLMWRAINAHPMGFANETPPASSLLANLPFGPGNPAYWHEIPRDGKYTGLRPETKDSTSEDPS